MRTSSTRNPNMPLRSSTGALLNGYGLDGAAQAYQKGWSSERVPLPSGSSRRHVSSSTFLPFKNGRAMPSKWEDAEKWIFNPISGDAHGGSPFGFLPHYSRPKSKSGPLRTPVSGGSSYLPSSPQMRVSEEGSIRNFPASSPFLTGVLVADHSCYRSAGTRRVAVHGGEGIGVDREGRRRSYSSHADQGTVRSVGVHVWSDLSDGSSSSLASSQDDDLEGEKDAAGVFSPETQRKDVATQMSPQGSVSSSPKGRSQLSPSSASPSPTIEEMQSHFSRLEVRDVQVDDMVVTTGWSMTHVGHAANKAQMEANWKNSTVEPRASAWEVSEAAKYVSKLKREEAKITAWENLQKAEAEAAIKNLEMKLEKKRSSSMDKIMRELRSAQGKAQEMRDSLAARQSAFWKRGRMACFGRCFTCHAA
ncbi:unnamed protein product [Spirodela intermedia]|uniref:Remorin C-terminal domain-containing protein n=1 Tax=Spirodela intermedia TaxID=51605 RepID=A0A7I8J2X2_SPIIN|nr:unnamed protein product [Spirodela intermedia]CAA6664332.1 unnamed protein product [Spirodela intermedia]